MRRPLVSVGMPVYNGEATVAAAIDSILRQTWAEWELVISDNASTDGTARICMDAANRDARVRYLRQPRNIGAAPNFRKVLDESRGEFFMWAAADDRRSEDFIEANTSFLVEHPDYVASCSPVRLDSDDFDPRFIGDEPVTGTPAARLLGVVPAHANGRFYSVFRREALLDCDVIDQRFLGSDWAVMAHVAQKGSIHRVDKGWTLLGAGGASRSGSLYRSARSGWLDAVAPFRTLSCYVWARRGGMSPMQKLRLATKLVLLNAFGVKAQTVEAWQRRRR